MTTVEDKYKVHMTLLYSSYLSVLARCLF